MRGVLLNNSALIYDYLDAGTVHGLLDQHLSGASNRRLLIWSLLSFEHFLRTFDDA